MELESGETGRPADPATLPRPALWPEPPGGEQPVAISGREGENPQARAHVRSAYVGVALMVAGLVLLGVGAVAQAWWPAVLGVGIGLAGAVVSVRSRVMEAATVGEEVRGG